MAFVMMKEKFTYIASLHLDFTEMPHGNTWMTIMQCVIEFTRVYHSCKALLKNGDQKQIFLKGALIRAHWFQRYWCTEPWNKKKLVLSAQHRPIPSFYTSKVTRIWYQHNRFRFFNAPVKVFCPHAPRAAPRSGKMWVIKRAGHWKMKWKVGGTL